ncbi:Uncharacterized protein GBIM_19850 [Gryllus bimaculatus]|nr:Uncharacterized protein GBIM_19850 [Gryllus bimaculatus]
MAEYCEYEWGLRRQEIDITCRNSEKKTCDKKQAVIAVQQLIPSRPEIDFLRTDEDFILRFLHARKCGVQESFDLLANYYSYRKRNKDLFLHFNANEIGIRNALKDGFPGVLPERDRCELLVLKIYLHGNNLSTLHDYVTKDILPAELGGEGPSYNPVQWADKLLEIEQTLGAEVGKGLETSDSKSESIRKSETFPVHCSKKLDGSNGYETTEVYEC